MTEMISGFGPNGRLVLIGVSSNPIEVAPVQLIRGGKSSHDEWQRRVSRCADDVNELPMGKRACSGVGALRAEALILVVRNREDHPR